MNRKISPLFVDVQRTWDLGEERNCGVKLTRTEMEINSPWSEVGMRGEVRRVIIAGGWGCLVCWRVEDGF